MDIIPNSMMVSATLLLSTCKILFIAEDVWFGINSLTYIHLMIFKSILPNPVFSDWICGGDYLKMELVPQPTLALRMSEEPVYLLRHLLMSFPEQLSSHTNWVTSKNKSETVAIIHMFI